MPILILGVLAIGAMFFMSQKGVSLDILPSLSNSLKDVAPSDQGGNYSTLYDDAYLAASEDSGIPFALLKAHSIRESNQNPKAIRQEPATKTRPPSASYGLLQLLWWKNSNRFSSFGWSDDAIGDGSVLYDPVVNCIISGRLMKQNLARFGNLRDTVNSWNTGTDEATRIAPGNYVNDVLKIYSTLVGEDV